MYIKNEGGAPLSHTLPEKEEKAKETQVQVYLYSPMGDLSPSNFFCIETLDIHSPLSELKDKIIKATQTPFTNLYLFNPDAKCAQKTNQKAISQKAPPSNFTFNQTFERHFGQEEEETLPLKWNQKAYQRADLSQSLADCGLNDEDSIMILAQPQNHQDLKIYYQV